MSRSTLLRINALAWSGILIVAILLRIMNRLALGEPISLVVVGDVWIIALWAVATPFILRSARLLPVTAAARARNGIIHLVLGTAFVVLTNAIVRVPLLRQGFSVFLTEEMRGLALYYPGAIVSYCVIVAIGHRLYAPSPLPPRDQAAGRESTDHAPLVIREWNRVHFIALDEIDWIEADNNHVMVHTPQRVYKGRERMSAVEARLDARRFVRVHRSAIVHVPRIREVQPLTRGDQAVVLRSGKVVRVSRSRRHALEQALGTPL
jgi:hypothetical protein